MESDTRSLRSNKELQPSDDEKFDFDVDEYEIDPHKPLKILNRGYPPKSNVEGSDMNEVDGKRKLIESMILQIERTNMEDKVKQENMLPDDLYLSYHKKMMRHEARMLESDVVQCENEADKLSLWSEKLGLAQWQVKLKQITVIQNADDEEEMEKKRVLTKDAIDSMLAKYRMMKKKRSLIFKNNRAGKIDPVKHWSQIYDRIDRKMVLDYHSSSDEEEDAMNIEQIRLRRRRNRERQCRGSIVILLTMSALSHHTKYAIVAEPLRRPYVIRISSQERSRWNRMMKTSPEKFTDFIEFPSQVALPRRKVPIPLTINRENSVTKEILPYNENMQITPAVRNRKRSFNSVEVHTLSVRHMKRR